MESLTGTSSAEEKVLTVAKRCLGDTVESLTPIADFDSLEVMDLLLEIENTFSLKLPDTVFKDLRTIRDIAKAVDAALPN